MSKHMIRGKARMPDYWEWTCDLCGKRANTGSQNTRPVGWVPKGRTVHAQDFCSSEHEEQYKAEQAAKEGAAPEAPAQPDAGSGTSEAASAQL